MSKDEGLSFWEHLDVLRAIIIRIVVVTVLCGIVAFLFKDELFAVVLAPRNPDFLTYRLLARISGLFGGSLPDNPVIQLIRQPFVPECSVLRLMSSMNSSASSRQLFMPTRSALPCPSLSGDMSCSCLACC